MKCRAMTRIMQFCMVLVVIVSVFFYVPMEVEAGVSNSYTSFSDDLYKNIALEDSEVLYLKDFLSSDVGFFKISFDITSNFSSNTSVWLNNYLTLFNSCGLFQQMGFTVSQTWVTSNTYTENRSFYLDASLPRSDSRFKVYYKFVCALQSNPTELTVNCSYSVSNVVIEEISSVDYDSYTQGYNAGYSAGEQAGYGNGYSQGFTDGEASVDTDAIYDEAFQAGKDSVDTQSYYDAGYETGYQVAYVNGFDEGYDSGYDDAISKVAQWGADTTEYPKLLTTKTMAKWGNPSEVQAGVVTDVSASLSVDSGINVNHNHTYRFDISVTDYDVTGSSYIDPPVNHDLYFYVGSNEFYLISQNRTSCNQTLYVNGSTMSDVFGFIGKAYNVHVLDTQTTDQLVYIYLGYTVEIYDMGPTGDTQNHIANQTDKLNENADKNTNTVINGYDSSDGQTVNDNFKASVNDYHTAEDSLFTTAKDGLDTFEFVDFTSITGMVTSLSFVTSIMTSIYLAMGGDTGASGIILAVLFSVMLVSMAIGLYRYYVSNGKSGGSNKGGD